MAEIKTNLEDSSSKNDDKPPSPPPIDQSQNPSSPYYLHPGENPGFVLVHLPLNGDNFYNWSRAIKRALSSKNKLKFINGSILKLAAHDILFDAWQRCNDMVVSWITRTLSPHISQSTASFDNARTLWLNLETRFT